MTRHGLLLALAVLCAHALAGAQAAAAAAAAKPYRPCALSLRDQRPPGGTPAYDLTVSRARTSCATARRVTAGFHRCRTRSGYRCRRTVLRAWRCSATRDASRPTFRGTFTCRSRARRVRGTYRQDTPSCFGAAARDPLHRCVNPARTLSRRDDLSWVCDPGAVAGACLFGYLEPDVRGHFAVIGDSHVGHWRPALGVVAQSERWRGYSISAGGCYFSATVTRYLEGCGEFYRSSLAWFADHPQVSTVFVTSNADTPITVLPGETYRGLKVDGFAAAFQALPPTVKHVVVLRDTTVSTPATMDCLSRAVLAGTQRLATVCPLARSIALRPDMGVEAVRRLRSSRYASIDLSDFICAPRKCFPVVGGAQVNQDVWGHLDTPFARTLGPYLLRELRRLMTAW